MGDCLLWNMSRDTLLAPSLRVVRGLWQRLANLVCRWSPREGEAVLVTPCRGLPARFVREPLDLVFLDERGRVLQTVSWVRPGERVGNAQGTVSVIAMPANSLRAGQVGVGDRLSVVWARPNRG